MPWQESSVLEQRLRFVIAASRKRESMSGLCREFGISRQTGYKWLKRYEAEGSRAMADRSRKPERSPARTAAAIEEVVAELRRERPDWGAPKLQVLLAERWGGQKPIAVRTLHRILQRHGLIEAQDSHRAAPLRFQRSQPNELWQMDFKGSPKNNTAGVGPLSILDDHSRYLMDLRQLGSTRMEGVRATLERCFQQCGVPEAMLMDHGTPWWNAASPWGLTEVAVWIMRQGIRLRYSGIGHPQTQGKVERMHAALARATRRRRADLLEQGWLDEFRHEYNHLRPHEALDMATPASRWRPSARLYQCNPGEWEYPAHMQTVRLAGEGQLSWAGRRWEISNALRRQLVGLARIGDRVIVYFCRTPIRELDRSSGRSFPMPVDVHRSLQR